MQVRGDAPCCLPGHTAKFGKWKTMAARIGGILKPLLRIAVKQLLDGNPLPHNAFANRAVPNQAALGLLCLLMEI